MLQALEKVVGVPKVDLCLVCALMASSRSLAARLCNMPIKKLVVQVNNLDQALGAAHWLAMHGSSISQLEVKWTADYDGAVAKVQEWQHASRAVATALSSMRGGMLQGLVIRGVQMPASLFASIPSPRAWTSLLDLHLVETGLPSAINLSSLTCLTSLQLGVDGGRFDDEGVLSNVEMPRGARDRQVLPGTCLPTGLCRLYSVGATFDSLAHLTNLTSLTVQPFENEWLGACPVLPASTGLLALDIEHCDSFPACLLHSISSMTNLTHLALSYREGVAPLRLALAQLLQLQHLSVYLLHGRDIVVDVADILLVGQLQLGGNQFGRRLENVRILSQGRACCSASTMQQLSVLTKLTRLELSVVEASALQHVSAVSSLVRFAAYDVSSKSGGMAALFVGRVAGNSNVLPHLKELILPPGCMGGTAIAFAAKLCLERGIKFRRSSECIKFHSAT